MHDYYSEFIQAFIQWAQTVDDIRCARIIGSRTTLHNPSTFIDLDIEFYTTRPRDYRVQFNWIEAFYPVWLVTPDDFGNDLHHWTSRWKSWVLFATLDHGLAVDFIIHSHHRLMVHHWKNRLQSRPQKPIASHHILFDKDGQLTQFGALPKPIFVHNTKPTSEKFTWHVHEFWGIADRAVRYLGRGYRAEARRLLSEALQRHIRQMMMWHAGIQHNWSSDMDWRWHHIDQWAIPDELQALETCYASQDNDDLKRSILATFTLFRTLATQVAEKLNYPYPQQIDRMISNWILKQLDLIDLS